MSHVVYYHRHYSLQIMSQEVVSRAIQHKDGQSSKLVLGKFAGGMPASPQKLPSTYVWVSDFRPNRDSFFGGLTYTWIDLCVHVYGTLSVIKAFKTANILLLFELLSFMQPLFTV